MKLEVSDCPRGGHECTDSGVRRAGLALALVAVALLTACAQTAGFAQGPEREAHVTRGLDLLAARQYKQAKAELNRARPFETQDTRALMGLAVAADMEGDFKLSDRAYDVLMTQNVDRAVLFNNMAYSFMLRGDLARAATYLAEAARIGPDNPTVANNLDMLKKAAPL